MKLFKGILGKQKSMEKVSAKPSLTFAKRWLLRLKKILFVCLLSFIGFLVLDLMIPLPIDEFEQRSFAQVVVDQSGLPLRAFPDGNGVWRYPVTLKEVSPLYLQALINYEDRYFYQHFGVNPFAVMRALGQWVQHGEVVSGASTLTMQVARILEPHEKSISGKLKQMFRALQLEWHYSKNEILTYYVNYAPFGGPIEGVQAASYTYLGKPAIELTHSEAALLAVMPQSPSRFRPDRHPQRAQAARDKLLNRLSEFSIWSTISINEAKQEKVWADFNSRPMIAPLLTRKLINKYPQQQVIHSTINIELQSQLELLVTDYMERKSDNMSASLVLVDNSDLSTLAYIGSADFANKKRSGYIDMNTALRSPGSTLKPFIYAMAIDKGIIHSESLLFDVPQSFSGYRPKNFTESFSGPVSVSQALGRSLNMPAVQVLDQISPESFYAKLKNSGVNLQLPVDSKPNLSLALGGGGTNMQELVGLFSSLGRKGKAGKIRLSADDKQRQYKTMTEGSAWIIQNILSQVPLNKQLNSRHISSKSIAYKTGTSYGYRDAWVLATNQKFTLGIWIGQPDGSFGNNNTGRESAVPLLQKVLSVLPNNWLTSVPQPMTVNRAVVCWPLGTKKSLQEKSDCHKRRIAYLLEDTAPPTISDSLSNSFFSGLLTITIDSNSGKRVLPHCAPESVEHRSYAVWPRILEAWLAKPFRRQSYLPSFKNECDLIQSATKLNITGIHPKAVLFQEPHMNKLPDIQLVLEGSVGKNYWFLNGQLMDTDENEISLKNLKVGKYLITAIDSSANFAELSFEVAP